MKTRTSIRLIILTAAIFTSLSFQAAAQDYDDVFSCGDVVDDFNYHQAVEETINFGQEHWIKFEPERTGGHSLWFQRSNLGDLKVTPYWSDDNGQTWHTWDETNTSLFHSTEHWFRIDLQTDSNQTVYRFHFENTGDALDPNVRVTYLFYCDGEPPSNHNSSQGSDDVTDSSGDLNNSTDDADRLYSDASQAHSISPADDVDWFVFSVGSESMVKLWTDGDPDGDTVLKLYNADGRLIEESDDYGNSRYSYIDRMCNSDALVAETYYASVESYQNRHQIDDYSIRMHSEQCATRASHDPDGTPEEAELITLNISTNPTSIQPSTNVDWYKFVLDQKSSVTVETFTENNGDTELWLYRADMTLKKHNDDVIHGKVRRSSVSFKCTGGNGLEPGVYYVKVSGYQQNTPVARYNVRATATACSTNSGNQSITTANYSQLVVQHSNKCLDVSGLSRDNGGKIQQWSCRGSDNQLWGLVPVGDYYKIMAKHSGKCLDVWGVSRENGARVHQWTCEAGKENQLWQLVPRGDAYSLVAKHSGKCLDVSGVSCENGAELLQWDCHGGGNQLWRISASNPSPPLSSNGDSAPPSSPRDEPPPSAPREMVTRYYPSTLPSVCQGSTDIINLTIVPVSDRTKLWTYVKKCDGGTFSKSGRYYIRVDGQRRFGPFNYYANTVYARAEILPGLTGNHNYKIELFPEGQYYAIWSSYVMVEGREESR